MDAYTKQQKDWLDARFRSHDHHGIYVAHQPVYGFRTTPSEPDHTGRYIISYRVLQILADLSFDSFLDAGGGEGYKAHLVRKLWGVDSVVSDLSEEACKRAGELFGLPAVSADLHDLPFADEAFDLVLCSESLEHITDFRRAVDELLRITRRCLIITVPHESPDIGKSMEHHAHINSFTTTTLSYLEKCGLKVLSQRLLSPLLTIPAALADAMTRTHNPAWKHPRVMTDMYNRLVPATRNLLGSNAAAAIVRLDGVVSTLFRLHKGIIYMVVKDSSAISSSVRRRISPQEVIGTTVPPLRIRMQGQADEL